jgi:hypothetical protein
MVLPLEVFVLVEVFVVWKWDFRIGQCFGGLQHICIYVGIVV